MTKTTKLIVFMMVATAVILLLLQIIVLSVLAFTKRLVLLDLFLHQLEMVSAMMKKILQNAISMVVTVVL